MNSVGPLPVVPQRRARAALLLAALLAVAVTACTETFDGGDACPSLCPVRPTAFRDTTVEAIVLDTTVGGFPTLGLSGALLLANRPDTLVTRGVLRFDVVPTSFLPNKGSTSESITTVDSTFLIMPLDTTGYRGTTPITIEAYDVDTTENDSSQVVVSSLFRADRVIGSVTISPNSVGDTLRIPLSNDVLAAKIKDGLRLRVGLRIVSGSGQLRAIAFQLGSGVPFVRFDPSSDTVYVPVPIYPTTSMDGASADQNLAYMVYSTVDVGSPAPGAETLVIGGFPAYRTYLRFSVPRSITDSSTIVRAEVLLTQRPSHFGNVADSVAIVSMVPTTTSAITDMRRILDLSAEGFFAGLDSTFLVPRDSGSRSINILSLVRSWPALPGDIPRAVAFRISLEGAQPAELRFFSTEAAPALRPRLRITYLPRTETAIP